MRFKDPTKHPDTATKPEIMRESPKKKRSDKDLEKFDDLPPETKDLQQLKDHAEKSNGPAREKLDREIRQRSEGEDR
jgi:hypothetical protein